MATARLAHACPWRHHSQEAKGRAASALRAGQQADSLTGTVRQKPEARDARPDHADLHRRSAKAARRGATCSVPFT